MEKSCKSDACASCGSSDIDFKGSENDGEYFTYPYICDSCGKRGEVVYKLVFRQNVIT